jgi:glutathione synthase/RimK-type ligase-like ATP-grasp enzyme
MADIAWVTYVEDPTDPDPDLDATPVVAALAVRGISAEIVAWTDPDVDWSAFTMVLLRSAWDYTTRYAEFLQWLGRVEVLSVVRNPPSVVRRNADKRYLARLERAGVPIVPTGFIDPTDDEATVRAVVRRWPDLAAGLVVKPSVSAGARDTLLTREVEEAVAHVRKVQAGGKTVLVQPYLRAVDTEGEMAVVVIGGEPSHVIRKVPALTEGGHGDAAEVLGVSHELRVAALRVLDAEPGARDLLYARVDLVRDGEELRLMELELIEPSLFLAMHDGAVDAFADAVAAELTTLAEH